MPTPLKADEDLTENAVTKRLLIKHFRTVKNGLGMRLALMVVSIVAGSAVHASDCSDLFERLEQRMNAEWLDSVVGRTSGKDFFSVRSSLLRRDEGLLAVEQWNNDLSRALRAQLPPPARREGGMSLREAQDLFEYLNCHPVAGMRHLK